jgi:hypothetical protein
MLNATLEPEHTDALPIELTETLSAAGSVIVTEAVAVLEQVLSVTVTV